MYTCTRVGLFFGHLEKNSRQKTSKLKKKTQTQNSIFRHILKNLYLNFIEGFKIFYEYIIQEAKESFASLDLSKMTKFILKIMY